LHSISRVRVFKFFLVFLGIVGANRETP
jgi:hypothetical protein